LTHQEDGEKEAELEAKNRLSSIEESRNESDHPDFTLQMKEFSESEHVQKLRVMSPKSQATSRETGNYIEATVRTTERPFLSGRGITEISPIRNKKSTKLSKDVKEDDEEYQYYLEERGKKLRNSKDHSKRGVVIKLCSFGCLLIAYYIIDFAMHETTLQTYEQIVLYLKLICQRSPDLKYTTVFTVEEVAEDNFSIVYPTLPAATVAKDNYRIDYINRVYANQKLINSGFNEHFPGEFDTYFKKLRIYSYEDMCTSYHTNDPVGLATCVSLANGKLQLGLIQAEVWLMTVLQQQTSDFYAISPRDFATQQQSLNNPDYQSAGWVNYLVKPMLTDLVDTYMNASTDYLSGKFNTSKLKVASFLVVLGLLLLFVWLPYLEKLKQQIFRTKALLNMIPMAMLQKNKMLRDSFLSKEILEALK